MTIGNRSLQDWENTFADFLSSSVTNEDAAHDRAHIHRVVANARMLATAEQADLSIVIPAAWLHDCVIVPKHSPERSRASLLAAEAASTFLRDADYPAEKIAAIAHAIHAHSFSAAVPPQSLEAKVVQDADRLDALGAIGIARTLMLGGAVGSRLYDPDDPFARDREPDDRRSAIDHFYTKLLRLQAMMQTNSGRAEAERRTRFMHEFLEQLGHDIDAGVAGGTRGARGSTDYAEFAR